MTWLASLVSGIALVLAVSSPSAFGQRASLENPANASYASGIGLISGWACEAYSIEVYIITHTTYNPDGSVATHRNVIGPLYPAYGTARGDTQRTCGDTNNGIGLLFNWNLLGMGVTVWPCL